jgi:hypothetical protein
MQVLKLKSMTTAAAAAAASLGLSLAALAGPPVTGGFNAAQDAVRMSILRQAMLVRPNAAATPKVAATNQKATTATHSTGQPNQTCGSPTAPETPGHAASATGSAFNPNGEAGTV